MFHITKKPFGKIHHQKGVKAKTIVKCGFKYRNGLNVNSVTNLATILDQPHGGPQLDELKMEASPPSMR